MTKINKSILFKKAHQLAKKYEGNYKACFALALKVLYKQIKNAVKPSLCNLKKVYIEGEDEYRELSIMEAIKGEYVTSDEVKEILSNGKSKQIWYDSDYCICFEF